MIRTGGLPIKRGKSLWGKSLGLSASDRMESGTVLRWMERICYRQALVQNAHQE